jgi:hypothetical protein
MRNLTSSKNKNITALFVDALLADQKDKITHFLVVDGISASARIPGYQDTPLHLAQSSEVVSYLLSRGAIVSKRNALGESPMHKAANAQVVKALLQGGADINEPVTGNHTHWINGVIPKCSGDTPLHRAKTPDVIYSLLTYPGIDIEKVNNDGRLALEALIARGYVDFMLQGVSTQSTFLDSVSSLALKMKNPSQLITGKVPALVITTLIDDLVRFTGDKQLKVQGFLNWLKTACNFSFLGEIKGLQNSISKILEEAIHRDFLFKGKTATLSDIQNHSATLFLRNYIIPSLSALNEK